MTEADHPVDHAGPVLARRTVLRGVVAGGAVAAGAALLAACGSDGSATDAGASSSGDLATPTPSGDASSGSGGGGAAEVLVATADVPAGGGVVLPDSEVVVTQPTKGDFAGFSAICTHAGCLLADVSGGTINCNCHGSQFSIEDGSVVTGPATAPLPTVDVAVDGSSVVRS